MKKLTTLLLFSLMLFASYCVLAQTPDSKPDPSSGTNKMMIMGNAEAKFVMDSASSNFTNVNFKPIFLWRINEKLFVESEVEFETGDGEVGIGLEYANMCYKLNKYMTIHGGRFLQKFGAYRGRNGEAFLNRLPSDPVGFGDGGIGPMNEVGVGIQGGFPCGPSKMNYDIYVSNGPVLLTDSSEVGQFDYEAYIDNNKGKTYGGHIGLLPFSNSCVELGVSMEHSDKTGDIGTPFENIGTTMMAYDGSFFHKISPLKGTFRILGEYKSQNTDQINFPDDSAGFYSFKNLSSTFYVAASFRPNLINNKFIRNLEIAGRFSQFTPPANAPWGGAQQTQTAVSLDYWFNWNSLIKVCYQMQTDMPNTLICQLALGF
ncbi:MAG: hypothetical protein WCI97_07460 [Bacteroidota bacterium]